MTVVHAEGILARRGRSLADFYYRLRNRVLSDPGFQRWAARFPLTRLIARRRASALFDLCAGFVYSQVLHSVVRLGVLEELSSGPQTASELAPRLSLSLEAARRLLDAAVSLKLVDRRGKDAYGLGIHGASLMGNPAVAAMVEHHALLYRDLADPVALLRGAHPETELHRFWGYAGSESKTASVDGDVGPYSELMAGSLTMLAQDILEAYPHDGHDCLLDVGGGEGAFLEAAAAQAPKLSLVLFDLPAVARRARERLERAGLSARSKVVEGDVFRDDLPKGADLITLVRVIHDHDDARAIAICRAARRALRPGGVILIAEPMAGTNGAHPMGDAYFGFYLLAMGQGRPRTANQLRGLLAQVGFDEIVEMPTRRPMLTRLLAARAV